jgi:hypothetical protein
MLILSTDAGAGDKKAETVWKISPCKTRKFEDTEGNSETLILGREYLYYMNKNKEEIETEKGKCHYYGDIYRFKENGALQGNVEQAKNRKEKQSQYEANIKDFMAERNKNIGTTREFIQDGYTLQIDDKLFTAKKIFFDPDNPENIMEIKQQQI